MARAIPLTLERLEGREVPAFFGIPWQDYNLTLSFVPDGTPIDGRPSVLFQSLSSAGMSVGSWQTEILRAFQAWSQNADINVAVVNDGGQPLGATGAGQGDARFGDIRISALPLSPEVMAITTPPGLAGNTRTGDIILNSNYHFTRGGMGGPDLFSVLLQESGHSLGVGNSSNPASPMFEQYSGARAGLTLGDVSTIQGLYGARASDSFEGLGNESRNSSTDLNKSGKTTASTSLLITADISRPQDVDYYRFKTPHQADSDGLVVWLQSKSRSLLAPKLTVYDATGNVVGSMAATSPAADDLTIHVTRSTPDSQYYVKVEGNSGTDFRIGEYDLKVIFDPHAPTAAAVDPLAPVDDTHTNDIASKATQLTTAAGYQANTHYLAAARLRDAADLDFYKIHTPKVGGNQLNLVTITVRSTDANGLAPRVALYDDHNAVVLGQILANGDGTFAAQFANVKSDKDYRVLVSADGAGAVLTGGYLLEVDFKSAEVNLEDFANATLNNGQPQTFRALHIERSQLLNLVLSVDGNSGSQTAVRMTIWDANHNAVFTLFGRAGDTVADTALLEAGDYIVQFTAGTADGSQFSGVHFDVDCATLSDPIGPGLMTSSGSTSTTMDYSVSLVTSTWLTTLYPVTNPWR